MGPERLSATSDQPMRELLVRSTALVSSGAVTGHGFLTLVVLPPLDVLKIVDSSIIIVLAGEDDVVDVAGVRIGDWMTCNVSGSPWRVRGYLLLVSYLPKPRAVSEIPLLASSGLTQVQTAHEGHLAIDEA